MRFGSCTTPEQAAIFRDAGYDFGEMPVVYALQPEQPGSDILPALDIALTAAKFFAEVWYLFLPGTLPVVGGDVDRMRLALYFEAACERAARFGGKVIVFGSAGSRQIPSGFPAARARQQLRDALVLAAAVAAPCGLTIALEPMSATVCNHINTLPEAMSLIEEADHPALGLCADLHHITLDNQPLEDVLTAGQKLAHVHVAGEGRRAPLPADLPRLTQFFALLKQMDYTGRVAFEGHWPDIAADAAPSLAVMRQAWQDA